jgi:hypothetical protein
MSMESTPERCELPDIFAPQRASAELVKRIRKLRWIGMEEEAERLQIALSCLPTANCMLAEAPDTD